MLIFFSVANVFRITLYTVLQLIPGYENLPKESYDLVKKTSYFTLNKYLHLLVFLFLSLIFWFSVVYSIEKILNKIVFASIL